MAPKAAAADPQDVDKDRPLLLRRRQDGTLHLLSAHFPPRHEFSIPWLLENTAAGVVTMTPEEVRLQLANASAVYTIDRSLMETEVDDGEGGTKTVRLAYGVWGVLASEQVGG